MEAAYSNNYQNPKTAAAYDEVICRWDEDPVWAIERGLLHRLIKKHVPNPRSARVVDFACGTGRILEALRPEVGHLTGVDISAAMLARAATRLPGVELLCIDVTAAPDALPSNVDLVTAFRFLLLAEPTLREACLKALAVCVRPGSGVLILNSHGNPSSFRFLASVRDRIMRRPRRLKAFSFRDMRDLAERCDLEVIDAAGCGFVPMSFQRVLPVGLCFAIEKALAGVPLLWRVGTNLIFVLKREDSATTVSI